jgi:hypothetical protein
MFKNSKKQGDAGLGQAIAYFTSKGYDVALPLTDSADWDLIVEIDGELKRVQVKTSIQLTKSGIMKFNANVNGGNKTSKGKTKLISAQGWDLLFLHHLITGMQAIIPKSALSTQGQINIGGTKYKEYII